ncbi:MAG: hypothetical protein IKS00_04430 [Bacteroidales bacterium]|nr:hypothetical protein [Bacteroidales bacterium]
MLATSCSKDDDNNAVNPKSNKSEQEGIPFTLRVNTGTTLKKVGYAEETTDPDKKGYYNITFEKEHSPTRTPT